MTTSIKLNINGNSEEFRNALPRLQAGLNNIATAHSASGMVNIFNAHGMSRVTVDVRYMSGALLRDVVSYLDEMSVLD